MDAVRMDDDHLAPCRDRICARLPDGMAKLQAHPEGRQRIAPEMIPSPLLDGVKWMVGVSDERAALALHRGDEAVATPVKVTAIAAHAAAVGCVATSALAANQLIEVFTAQRDPVSQREVLAQRRRDE